MRLTPYKRVDILQISENVLPSGWVDRRLHILIRDSVVNLPGIRNILQSHRIEVLHEQGVHPFYLQWVVHVPFRRNSLIKR